MTRNELQTPPQPSASAPANPAVFEPGPPPESARARSEARARAYAIRDRQPTQGLFAGQTWRISPVPLSLGPELVQELERLGRILLQFQNAANRIYRRSRGGQLPAWISRWLDLGKPTDLLEHQLSPAFKQEYPRVIRPDLLLTEDGVAIAELDSIPGGIGLTAWLNRTYAALGEPVVGGANGMFDGFAGIFGRAANVHIVVSEEAATYRPEMEWLAQQLDPERFRVQAPDFSGAHEGDAVYRFFELFDLPNLPAAQTLIEEAERGRFYLTPPPKPLFEEKLLFGLLWNENLRDVWRRELGEAFFQRLRKAVPYTWVLDPAPLPPHAAIPRLNLTNWEQLKALSQRERNLILKISGYSARAWGSRGVYLGSDLSAADWATAVDAALQDFEQSPFILQDYHKPKQVNAQWFDFATDQLQEMPGRVRLCPYYFVHGRGDQARAHLGGVLATICPANKKIVHGMSDAILTACTP